MGERGNSLNRGLDKYLGIPAVWICTLLRQCRKKRPFRSDSIAILCLGAIGDLLLLSALIHGIKTQSPHSHITLITSRANVQGVTLLAGVDVHQAFDVRNVRTLGALFGYLHRSAFDILIDSSQWSRLGAVASALSGAGVLVGFDTHGQYRGSVYEKRVIHSNAVHETENFLRLGRSLWPALDSAPGLCLPDIMPMKYTLAQYMRVPFVLFHMWAAPGQGRHLKEWPPHYWATLIRLLTGKGYTVYLSGGKDDVDATENFIRTYLTDDTLVYSLAGKTTLSELAWLLRQALAVVSVNTGILHLAALSGAPTIGLHGATNPARWGPVGAKTHSLVPHSGHYGYLNLGFEYPHKAIPAMIYLPVEDVADVLYNWGVL